MKSGRMHFGKKFLLLSACFFCFSSVADEPGIGHLIRTSLPFFSMRMEDSLELLRKQRFRTPELVGFTCKPALGQLTVKQVITIPADSWYALLISVNNQPKNAWNRIWGIKLEKLP